MFLSVDNFFLTTVNHRPLVWIAEVAAEALDHVAGCRIVVAAFRAFITFRGRREFTFEAAFEALIDRRVGAEITDLVVGIVPNCLKCFRILFQVRILTVVDEATGTILRVILFKIEFLKRSR